MNYAKLKKQEPRIAELETMIKAFNQKSCTIAFFCSQIKSPLLQFVGWGRGGDESDPLASSDAYDLIHSTLCEMLPECPGDTCQGCKHATANKLTLTSV